MPGGTSPVQKLNSQLVDLLATHFMRRKEFGGLIDYTTDSTVTGWAAGVTKEVRYKKIGKFIFFKIHISGTSNAITASATLPFPAVAGTQEWVFTCAGWDNGANVATVPVGTLAAGASTINFYKDIGGTVWTNPGAKQVRCEGWYEAE